MDRLERPAERQKCLADRLLEQAGVACAELWERGEEEDDLLGKQEVQQRGRARAIPHWKALEPVRSKH